MKYGPPPKYHRGSLIGSSGYWVIVTREGVGRAKPSSGLIKAVHGYYYKNINKIQDECKVNDKKNQYCIILFWL